MQPSIYHTQNDYNRLISISFHVESGLKMRCNRKTKLLIKDSQPRNIYQTIEYWKEVILNWYTKTFDKLIKVQ